MSSRGTVATREGRRVLPIQGVSVRVEQLIGSREVVLVWRQPSLLHIQSHGPGRSVPVASDEIVGPIVAVPEHRVAAGANKAKYASPSGRRIHVAVETHRYDCGSADIRVTRFG